MIGRLTGIVVAEDADGTLVLDVGGIGYEVTAPLGTLGRAQADGERITLHVHTHVREDALALYGFATLEDKAAFRTLIGLPNVGPKIAIAILSAMPADELARAIAREDRARLNASSGVGKKTVERLLVELKDKLHAPAAATHPPPRVAGGAVVPSKAEQLASALSHLGFRPVQVERAMDAMRAKLDDEPLPDLIRHALALLAR
jgi:Holliday junction DNA helicase RuvA